MQRVSGDEPIVKNPEHWLVRICEEDRVRCRHYADTVRGAVARRGQQDGALGTAKNKPWWTDYHGKAAEVAFARAFSLKPSWYQGPVGHDVVMRNGVTVDTKFNWHPNGPHGCWLYLSRTNKESTARVLVLVTVHKYGTDRDYLLRGWMSMRQFRERRRPTPFDPEARGVPESELHAMIELYDGCAKTA